MSADLRDQLVALQAFLRVALGIVEDLLVGFDRGTAEPATQSLLDLPLPPNAPKEVRKERAKALHEQGHSIRDIADALGVSKDTVRRYLRSFE